MSIIIYLYINWRFIRSLNRLFEVLIINLSKYFIYEIYLSSRITQKII